ncbi:MAG: sulfide/dihydroorotate dehydrogenase-like FAD/NAD-binding protein [Clostridia bacterium]
MYKIVKKEIFSPTVKLMDVYAPKIAAKCQAGQFIILRMDEKGERIPLTIGDYDRNQGTITIVFQEVGLSTKELGNMEVGDEILDFVGPLGHATEIENYGTVVCIGGGLGIAPVYPIARALKEAGNKVITIIGARNEELLFWEDKMRDASTELIVGTDDGSYGKKGFTTDLLRSVIAKGEKIDKVWAIGPVIMMREICKVTREFNLSTIVSMNTIMVDGTGMCGACRLSVGNETKFACVDGPEFDGLLVDWDLAMRRMNSFKDKEAFIMAHPEERGKCKCH